MSLFPNVAAMYKWVNNFFPGAPSASQDFVHLVRKSDGTVLGWIDENGIRRGSLADPSIVASSPDWINVKNFGAIGNGKFIAGGAMTASSPILTTDTSSYPQNQFSPGMVGQKIMVQGAGASGADLWSTILSYQSPSQVTLANNASTSVPSTTTANIIIGGTDDTNAIQNAINAAALANVPCYIPSGVYLLSKTLVYTDTTVYVPPAIYGDGSFATILAWNDPGVVGPSTGTFNLNFDLNPFSMRGLSVFGNTLASNATPSSAHQEVLLRNISVGPVEDVVIQSTSFVQGFNIRISSGLVKLLYDSAQSKISLDGSTAESCSASAFLFGSDTVGDIGGVVQNCLALGDLDAVEACFMFEHGEDDNNAPITFIGCYSVGGAFTPVTPVGFKTRGCELINCSAAISRIPFWADASQTSTYVESQKITNCASFGVGSAIPAIASCVVGSFLPWTANTPFSLGWQVIDASGHVQKITTAGTLGNSLPTWNDGGGTTTDGTAVWTDQGVYSPTNAGAVVRVEDFSVAKQEASNTPYGLWKTAGQRVLLNYSGVSVNNTSGSAPILQSGLGASLAATDLLPVLKSANTTDTQGLYQIDYYFECTTSSLAGMATPTITWTDDVGAQSFSEPAYDLTSRGHQSGSLIVRSIGPIQIAVALADVSRAPVYGLFATATQIG